MDYDNRITLAQFHLGLYGKVPAYRSDNYLHPTRGGYRGYTLWERRRALEVLEESGC